MKKNNIIKFDFTNHLIQKACSYVESPNQIFEERKKAVSVLIQAMKHADSNLLKKIIILLSSFGVQEAALPLYKLIIDPNQQEDIRHLISIQFSVIFPKLHEPQPLLDRFLENIKHPDTEMRIYAAVALGWEGNHQAVMPLLELLYDPDIDVQQAAVHALSNLRDDRIFGLLLDRLKNGSNEQQKSILFNLWQFESKKKDTAEIYLKYLNHKDPELRFDALTLLNMTGSSEQYIKIYCKCLDDPVARIRLLALQRLGSCSKKVLTKNQENIEKMLMDPDYKVQLEAKEIIASKFNNKIIRFDKFNEL